MGRATAIFTALDEQTVVVAGADAAGIVLLQLATATDTDPNLTR